VVKTMIILRKQGAPTAYLLGQRTMGLAQWGLFQTGTFF